MTNSKCNKCESKHYLVRESGKNDECVTQVDYCVEQTVARQCIRCEEDYRKITQGGIDICKKKHHIENCGEQLSDNVCKICKEDYVKLVIKKDDETTMDTCVKEILHCADQISEKECRICKLGYNKAQQGSKVVCKKVIANCKEVDSVDNTLCKTCADGYIKFENKNIYPKYHETCVKKIENCKM